MKLAYGLLRSGIIVWTTLLSSPGALAQSHEETSLWESVRSSKDPEDYKAYLDKYPDGVYAPIAKRRITSLEAAPATTPSSGAVPATHDAGSAVVERSNLDYPSVVHFCALHCATWNFQNGHAGDSQYGVTIVHWTPDSVVLNRSDPPSQWFPNGLKGVITGRMSPEHNKLVDGKITWTFGTSGTSDARVTWGSALNEIPGQDGPPPQPAAQEAHLEGKKKPTQESAKALPTDEAANAEVDAGFKRWSSAWMFDRYVAGSAHATDRGLKDETYVVRGLFDFVRSGTKLTIPFAAAYTKANDGYALSNLCYNDTSSGMTDCINPNDNLAGRQAAATQSRQFLGSIVLLGLVAAMSEDEETCVKRYTFFGEAYFECE